MICPGAGRRAREALTHPLESSLSSPTAPQAGQKEINKVVLRKLLRKGENI
jgi:hypothetical protein